MPVHLDAPVLRSSQVQSAHSHPVETLSSQGRASDRSTLLSMREAANGNISISCDWFTAIPNRIKSFFVDSWIYNWVSSFFAFQPTRADLIERGNEILDAHFNGAGLSFPLKAIVFMKYNGELLGTSQLTIDNAEMSAHQATVKAELNERLPADAWNDRSLEIVTLFVMSANADAANPRFNVNVSSYRNGVQGGGQSNDLNDDQLAVLLNQQLGNDHVRQLAGLLHFLLPVRN